MYFENLEFLKNLIPRILENARSCPSDCQVFPGLPALQAHRLLQGRPRLEVHQGAEAGCLSHRQARRSSGPGPLRDGPHEVRQRCTIHQHCDASPTTSSATAFPFSRSPSAREVSLCEQSTTREKSRWSSTSTDLILKGACGSRIETISVQAQLDDIPIEIQSNLREASRRLTCSARSFPSSNRNVVLQRPR